METKQIKIRWEKFLPNCDVEFQQAYQKVPDMSFMAWFHMLWCRTHHYHVSFMTNEMEDFYKQKGKILNKMENALVKACERRDHAT